MRDSPDEDAYSRVTDPDRYRRLASHARETIDRLISDFDCHVDSAPPTDLPDRLVPGPGEELVTVRPVAPGAATLVFRIRDRNDVAVDPDPHRRYVNHGIGVLAGRWHQDAFPQCGCDACDEEADELCDLFDELVVNVVSGPFSEEWDGHELSYSFATGSGRGWSIDFARKFAGVRRARHDWEPWTRR